jgi:sterol desaturase/sphingolipid hydroxylase (fatty acid hydroxylase superfamily)
VQCTRNAPSLARIARGAQHGEMSPQLSFSLLLSALHTLTLCALTALFAFMFRRGMARRFQVAGGKAPDAALSRSALREVLLGQALFPVVCYFAVYPLWTVAGGRMDAELPPPWLLAVHLIAFIALEDTIFYWGHRLLHTRYLFSRVHYRHHRFRVVRGHVAEYAHPLENLLNLLAFFAGPIALGSPLPVVAIWIVVRMAETVEAHSGFTFTGSSSRHAFHHLHAQRGCYGSFMSPWDRLLGTDRLWRAQRSARTAPATAPAPP